MIPGDPTEHEHPSRRGLDGLVESLLRLPDADEDTDWAARVARAVGMLRGVVAVQVIRLGSSNPVLAGEGMPIDPSTSMILSSESMLGSTLGSLSSHESAPGIHAIRIGPREAVIIRMTGPDDAQMRELGRVLPAAAIAAERIDELRRVEDKLTRHRNIERNIAEQLSGVKDAEGLGRAVIRVLTLLFDVEQSAIYFRDPSKRQLRLVASGGFEDWEREEAERTAWERHPGRVIRSGEPFIVDDVRLDPHGATDNTARRFETRSRCWLPVRSVGEVVGALGAGSPRVAAFQKEHVEGLQFLADLAGLTWSRLQEANRRARRDRILMAAGDTAEMLLAARRWRDVMPQLVESIRAAFDARSTSFIEVDGGKVGGHPDDPSIPAAFLDAVYESTSGGVTGRGGHPIAGFPPDRRPIATPFVAVPVTADSQRVGVLLVIDEGDLRVHDENSIAALRAFAEPLGSKVARDRLEDSLRQIDRMDALGQLAGGVAHDINNLLMPILGLASMLASTESDPERREKMESIQLAAERGREFVEQVLLLTRRRVVTDERTRLADIVQDAIRLALLADHASIDVDLAIDTPDATVIGDRTALLRMTQNLLVNARQAIGDGRGTIRIEITRRADHAVLSITDDGCGIPDDVRRRLFEPFFTTRRSASERGLGLTIVHRVVTELGGTVRVESTVGTGTTFTIELPAAEPSITEAIRKSEPRRPAAAIPTSSPKTETAGWILVVDDDDMVRSTTKALIESLGHTVRDATGGKEALRLVAEFADAPPELVLTDLSMPGMDGLELVAALRTSGYAGAAAVITGYGEDAFDTAREVGVDRILRKPISRKELGEAIAGLIPGAGS